MVDGDSSAESRNDDHRRTRSGRLYSPADLDLGSQDAAARPNQAEPAAARRRAAASQAPPPPVTTRRRAAASSSQAPPPPVTTRRRAAASSSQAPPPPVTTRHRTRATTTAAARQASPRQVNVGSRRQAARRAAAHPYRRPPTGHPPTGRRVMSTAQPYAPPTSSPPWPTHRYPTPTASQPPTRSGQQQRVMSAGRRVVTMGRRVMTTSRGPGMYAPSSLAPRSQPRQQRDLPPVPREQVYSRYRTKAQHLCTMLLLHAKDHLTRHSCVTQYLAKRSLGLSTPTQRATAAASPTPHPSAASISARRLPLLLKEEEKVLGVTVNKVFASQWLSENQVVLGTKCNTLMVLNLETDQLVEVPVLRGSYLLPEGFTQCGIHTISISPSGGLLATGALNTTDLAVYKLPAFDPVCLGEKVHKDWIFASVWLDDQFLVTGSRDNVVAMWSLSQSMATVAAGDKVPNKRPVANSTCYHGEKIRALHYQDMSQKLSLLSTDGLFHQWDVQTWAPVSILELPYCQDNVSLAHSPQANLYATGSKANVTFIDPRQDRVVSSIHTGEVNSGVRSLSFSQEVVTLGTGEGNIFFFDVRAGKYIECTCCPDAKACVLKTGTGWMYHDDVFFDLFAFGGPYPNAVYTHCYNPGATKLFTAGGPLQAGLTGNYAGLWQ